MTTVSPGARPEPAGYAARSGRFARFAWWLLAYTLLVILFGAIVRITGSGAGCGQHWPTCHGEIAHLPKTVETAIEFGHRATSGILALLSIVLVVLSMRWFPPRSVVRRASFVFLAFIVVESLIGAALVLFGLVADNDSVARALVMAVHLVSTSALTGALVVAAFTATRGAPIGAALRQPRFAVLVFALIGLVLVSMTGAVTALGDTLYPPDTSGSLGARIVAEQSSTAHFLVRMRALHPLLAVAVSVYLTWVAASGLDQPEARLRRAAQAVLALTLVQVGFGVLNVWFGAPPAMQVIHLALAKGLFIALVLLTLEELSLRRVPVPMASGSPGS
jgi:heme A synthase